MTTPSYEFGLVCSSLVLMFTSSSIGNKYSIVGACSQLPQNAAEAARRHQGDRQVIVTVGRLALEAPCESRLTVLIVKSRRPCILRGSRTV